MAATDCYQITIFNYYIPMFDIRNMRFYYFVFHAITLLLWAADEFYFMTPNP